ncbi:MAG TPA: acetate--CoA ligase family protein [Thermoplasmata archaeon]|nr:acetate--CoA ligase family protein [Thermoplasmata archaeon]
MTDIRLEAIFAPQSIAVIGASRHPGKIGYEILRNLIVNEYQGILYPVNPNATSIHGIRAYPTVADIPDPVDLAVITVPAESAVEAAEACGRKGVRGLVVITAGFREVGGAGVEREARLLDVCARYGLTMVGPNCMGVINTHPAVRMDATFAPTPPLRGGISLVTQSGALGIAILEHAKSLGVGFAKFCSLGNKAQVSLNDLLESWRTDADTKTILAYIENFGNPSNFVRVARKTTKEKPVIAVKSGRSEAGSRAAASHTGSLGGSDLAAEAVFAQTGVLRANSTEELFDLAMAFSLQPLPEGNRVAIVSDAGGPAIMCVDELVAQGMRLADLSPATRASMQRWAPPEASLRNPIDLTPQASLDDYRHALEAVLADDAVDAVIAIYVPPVRPDELDVAQAVWETAKEHPKPVLCNFLGRAVDSPGFVELVAHGVPSYLFPEAAARSLAAMHRYAEYRKRDEGELRAFDVDRTAGERILARAREEGRRHLRADDANALLEAYGIRTAAARFVPRLDGLPKAAAAIRYPVVLKAVGPEIVHKTEQQAVLLGVRDERALVEGAARISRRLQDARLALEGFLVQEFVEGGKEVILGMVRDKVYGPLLAFGLGGIYVEYLKDVAFGVPPLTDRDAMRMIESIRTFPVLRGVRGEEPRDLDALQEGILRLAQLVSDHPSIVELDLNPVVALPRGQGYRAVDARIVLAPNGNEDGTAASP